jgi:hypothetical protein
VTSGAERAQEADLLACLRDRGEVFSVVRAEMSKAAETQVRFRRIR